MKIIYFSNPSVQFINETWDWSIQNLPYNIINYTYDDLKQNKVDDHKEECILILEAGQTQLHHSGWTLNKFKQKFPNSKIVLWCSDSMYYIVNNLGLQWGNDIKPDLIIELTPTCADLFHKKGFNIVTIPWTISKKLYKKLQIYRDVPIIKDNDYIFMASCDGEYRHDLVKYIKGKNHSIIIGGNHHMLVDYKEFARSWINIASSSHNRPELCLSSQRTLKGWRDAASIACGTLVLGDDDSDTRKMWPESIFHSYDWGDFDKLCYWLDWYKHHLDFYKQICIQQLKWLQCNLLDDLLYKTLKENKII